MEPKFNFGRINGWELTQALKYKYLNLFNLVHKKQATVAKVFNSMPLNVCLLGRQSLAGNKLVNVKA